MKKTSMFRIGKRFAILLVMTLIVILTSSYFVTAAFTPDGWTTTNSTGWSLLDNNILHANASGLTLISTYSIDIKANTSYTLSYNIQNTVPSCKIYFDFNDGKCTSANDSTYKTCFNNSWMLNETLNQSTIYISSIDNDNATNGVYFKDVKFRLTTGTGCTDVSIANISLIESTYYYDKISYNYSALPSSGITQTAGCCPIDFCWNGMVCVDSKLWMTNTSYQGIWNTILTYNWTNRHVDTINQSQTISYRCVVVNSTSNESQWVPSQIKYDWNYEKSGYCASETDCFVNNSYTRQKYYNGCIHNGEIISDAPYMLGQGNHYCHMGNWTTRSYIVATLLQNVSESNNYVLQCYDNTSLTYNIDVEGIPLDKVLSACVLIIKKEVNKQQIITGVIVDDKLGETTNAAAFLETLKEEYKLMYNVDITPTDTCLSTLAPISNTNFTTCIDEANLQVYYETNYKYFVVSDSRVLGIEQETIWDTIAGFFKGLFSSPIISQPFSSTNYTTNYDRIYVMRNQSLNVTAVEEAKYDEAEQAIATILYVKYSGSNINNNPIYKDLIFKSVNDSMIALGKTNITVSVNTSNISNEQELIIKSQNRSGLWPYFTSILRTK